MRYLAKLSSARALLTTSALAALLAVQAISAELPRQTFADGKRGHVNGVILSHEGGTLKVRGQEATVCTINISANTKIKGRHAGKDTTTGDALLPGLYIKAKGKGDERGELMATKITYNGSSLRTFHQADARAAVVGTRVATVEQRSETLENRAVQLESRAAQLDEQGKQTRSIRMPE